MISRVRPIGNKLRIFAKIGSVFRLLTGTIGEGVVARHMRVISEFGFSEPILVRDCQVYLGCNMVLAARKLGLGDVPAIECSHLSDEEARAPAVASKRIGGLGERDLEVLWYETMALNWS